MRILWISDSPDTPSGFGNVTRFVCEGLARRGHDVSIMGWQTKRPEEWRGCRVYPSVGRLASDSVFPFIVRHRPELVIALADVWWLPYFAAPHMRRQMELTDTPWALYFPIDGDLEGERLPPSWVELLRQVDVRIAMSAYGQRVASGQGLSCHYIPHGVDLEVFCPPPSREEAKARVNAAGKFLVLSDSRNQPRKMLPRLLDAFQKFARDREDVLLHLHTDPDDEFTHSGSYSYDVRADVRHLGLESKVRFSPGMAMKQGGGLPLTELAAYYQAADVHLLASSGEGFGLPTLQAAAAGAVPIAGAYTASLELVEGHGESVAISDWTENEFGIRRGLIDVDDAAAKLARLHGDRELLHQKSARSRQFAVPYGWDAVLDQWDRLVRSLAMSAKRIAHVPVGTTEAFEKFASKPVCNIPGVSVSVKVVERKFGQNEAAILADARRVSDVRIPVLLSPCDVGGVRVPRTVGYVGIPAADASLFEDLKRIFPIASAWVVLSHSENSGVFEAGKDLHPKWLDCPEEARFELAQSILLLNVSGRLSEQILLDAALYGVPCIGSSGAPLQSIFWPELAADDSRLALRLARGLLTNAAWMQRAAHAAQIERRARFAADEEDAAQWLRRLHAQEKIAAAAGVEE